MAVTRSTLALEGVEHQSSYTKVRALHKKFDQCAMIHCLAVHTYQFQIVRAKPRTAWVGVADKVPHPAPSEARRKYGLVYFSNPSRTGHESL